MIELYFKLVRDGLRTLESVPEEYREQVNERLEKYNAVFNNNAK